MNAIAKVITRPTTSIAGDEDSPTTTPHVQHAVATLPTSQARAAVSAAIHNPLQLAPPGAGIIRVSATTSRLEDLTGTDLDAALAKPGVLQAVTSEQRWWETSFARTHLVALTTAARLAATPPRLAIYVQHYTGMSAHELQRQIARLTDPGDRYNWFLWDARTYVTRADGTVDQELVKAVVDAAKQYLDASQLTHFYEVELFARRANNS